MSIKVTTTQPVVQGDIDWSLLLNDADFDISESSSPPRIKKSMTQHVDQIVAAEEEIESFEMLQQMRKVFADNDLDSDGKITASELLELSQRLGQPEDEQRVHKVVDLLRSHMEEEGVGEWSDAQGIPFDIFFRLLQSREIEEAADKELSVGIVRLRNLFVKATNAKTLAKAVDIDMMDLGIDQRISFPDRLFKHLDVIMGIVIFANAICIGVSLDHGQGEGWVAVEAFFVALYTVEVVIKVSTVGPSEFVLGAEWAWHWFDTGLVIVGSTGVILELLNRGDGLSNWMWLRLLRLARLVRLVRLVRAFKDLSIMVTGLLAGLKTMMSVMVLLAICVYALAIVLTSTVGIDDAFDYAHKEQLFGRVPDSMFTVFVCLTDGCTDPSGQPISHFLYEKYGMLFFLAYCLAVTVITFGLFNLIMAIFVENTMQAAKSNNQQIATARHRENLRVARKLKRVIRHFTQMQSGRESAGRGRASHFLSLLATDAKDKPGLRTSVSKVFPWTRQGRGLEADPGVEDMDLEADYNFRLTREAFARVFAHPVVQTLLDELEIDETDRRGLFDVLDSDGSGTLTVEELVSGLMAVRGLPRKSDSIATMLAVKSVQKNLRSTAALLLQNQHSMQAAFKAFDQRISTVERCMDRLVAALPCGEGVSRL